MTFGIRLNAAMAVLAAAAALSACDQVKAGFHAAIHDQAAASVDALPAAGVVGELRTDFPQDYARLRDLAATEAANGGGVAGVQAASAKFMRTFYATHEPDAEQAPAAALLRVTTGDLQALEAAQAIGDDACVALWSSGQVPPANRSTPAMSAALQALGRAHVAAVRAGIDHPVGRPSGAVVDRPSAVAAVAAAARFGATSEEIIHGDRQVPAVRCRAGIAFYRGTATLPPEQAARVQTVMLHAAFPPTA